MTVATARTAAGSLFGTVTSAAGSVSSVFETTTRSISMLDKYVSDAQKRQIMRSAVAMAEYGDVLAEETALSTATRKIQVDQFVDQSPAHRQYYGAAYDRVQAILAGLDK